MSRSAQSLGQAEEFVTKYMQILGIADAMRPTLVARNNLGSAWLGRNTFNVTRNTSLIEIQARILSEPKTLERVVAHEIIHHHDGLKMPTAVAALVKLGIKPNGHGKSFLEGAAKINAVMGKDFVTIRSDEEYVQAPNTKEFFILIAPVSKTPLRLGYAWAVRISPEACEWVKRRMADGAQLFRTKNPRWTHGSKIKKYASFSYIPDPNSEYTKELNRIYLNEKPVDLTCAM